MVTLETLKKRLRQAATSSARQSLSDAQYSAGFDILLHGSQQTTYRDFVIPQLSQLFAPSFNAVSDISILEIGPGPRSVLASLPNHLRRKIVKYVAYEPNKLFASRLKEWCSGPTKSELPFPGLESSVDVRIERFSASSNNDLTANASSEDKKFDIILFCHSMYGMDSKKAFIEKASKQLNDRADAMVVVFHRDSTLDFGDLICCRLASFPHGVVRVPNDDETLDNFASFITGYGMQESNADEAVRLKWRDSCRSLGSRKDGFPDELVFSSPEIMVVFNQYATRLSELTDRVFSLNEPRKVKNSLARLRLPSPIVRPTDILQIQQCVHWASEYGFSLTVLGGSHSGHCLIRNLVAVDMSAFDRIHFVPGIDSRESVSETDCLIVVGAGCRTGDIVGEAMARGVTVPLGSRPSVGAGLWLQGGIGHLARLHGLSCDAIVGAVLVSVGSGQVLSIGNVPSSHQPRESIRPEHEDDLLWAVRGAGTNFGIVISVILKACRAPTYLTRNWIIPLEDDFDAHRRLCDFGKQVTEMRSRDCSADAYLYYNAAQLHMGVTFIQSQTTGTSCEKSNATATRLTEVLGPETSSRAVNGVDLFETEMYISGMHGGHGGGKTSSFKRCLFLKGIGTASGTDVLVAAIHNRPSHLCYFHLLHGGGAIADVAADDTAFGCRDWDFACVITGVWDRAQDGTEAASDAVNWVYKVARDLLPIASGVYGADLGPDPRDAVLAAEAFGSNRPRLARLKRRFDPHNILGYACPLPTVPRDPKLIILVTGNSGVGKDHSATHFADVLVEHGLTARIARISDTIKREYAAHSGAEFDRLIGDRAYKERHRPALTAFYRQKVQQRPWLPEAQFLQVVHGALDVDVLLITGMRDESPVAVFAPLVPNSKLLEVRVNASEDSRRARRGDHSRDAELNGSGEAVTDGRPSFTFNNDDAGPGAAVRFAEHSLLPLLHRGLQCLADMVCQIPDFPRPGIEFRHVLDICQQVGGLALCTTFLQSQYGGHWDDIDILISCEAGGFVFGSALADRLDKPLALVRKAGKLPPPTVSVDCQPSHISSSASASDNCKEQKFEMSRNVIPAGGSVVVVDDVLASGRTLCAMLSMLEKAGVNKRNIGVMVVAELPIHRGRDLLRRSGYGGVSVQSLLVFGCT